MSRFEEHINRYLRGNSGEFLRRLKKYGKEMLTQNKPESSIFSKMQAIDDTVRLEGKRISEHERRESSLDLYYSTPSLIFIIELKSGKVGFRGLAQAAYYNTCILDGHDFVLLLGNSKGLDFDEFSHKCLKDTATSNVHFVGYSDIGLNVSHKEDVVSFSFR